MSGKATNKVSLLLDLQAGPPSGLKLCLGGFCGSRGPAFSTRDGPLSFLLEIARRSRTPSREADAARLTEHKGLPCLLSGQPHDHLAISSRRRHCRAPRRSTTRRPRDSASLGKGPTDSSDRRRRNWPSRSVASGMGWRATTASFSNFVVADLARGGAPPCGRPPTRAVSKGRIARLDGSPREGPLRRN
jgi:hypothetical protein